MAAASSLKGKAQDGDGIISTVFYWPKQSQAQHRLMGMEK